MLTNEQREQIKAVCEAVRDSYISSTDADVDAYVASAALRVWLDSLPTAPEPQITAEMARAEHASWQQGFDAGVAFAKTLRRRPEADDAAAAS